ncbi:MAG: YhfC family intramembrane metalloprotease [Treponema sp.]|nr:YhfC family intramembrane metalloprotease [Treponema sp.]
MNPIEKVPVSNVVAIILTLIMGIAIPVLSFIFCRKKLNGKTKSFFVGAGVFFLFALILEQVAKLPFYLNENLLNFINQNLIISCLFAALYAGIFEEFGRFIAFKSLLRKDLEDDRQAFMYGAGHAGMEIIAILVISMISNLYYCIVINSGNLPSLIQKSGSATAGALQLIQSQLINTKSYVFYLSIIERLSAFLSHIAFSLIVFFASKNKKNWFYLPIAIILHAGLDFISGLLSSLHYPIWAIELFILLLSALNGLFAFFAWKNQHSQPKIVEVE